MFLKNFTPAISSSSVTALRPSVFNIHFLSFLKRFTSSVVGYTLTSPDIPCVDVIGLDVVDEDSNVIGKLTDVLQNAANDVYEITDNSGKTHLFPAIKECILNVNLDEGRMHVHVMKGLMDL